MEILDYRQSDAHEPPQAIIGLFTRPRHAEGDEAQRAVNEEWGLISHAWKRDADAEEAAAIAEEAQAGGTVVGLDEVNPERISMALATGQVVIKATDEQARQIMEHHRRDAFPPE